MSLILSGTDGLSDIDGSASTPAIRGTDANTGIFFPAADTIAFAEGGTEAMRIDSSGNVGIGTTSPSVRLQVNGGVNSAHLVLTGTAGRGLRISTSNPNGQNDGTVIYNAQDTENLGQHIWQTNGTERSRITSGGYFKATNNGTYNNSGGSNHEFYNSANAETLIVRNANASFSSEALIVSADRNTTNNSYYFLRCNVPGVGNRLLVADSGNVTNSNGSYGTISDIKNKENIVDATPKLDKINQLQVRNFNFKGDDLKQIGFVAQEFEQVFPSLIEEHHDKDADGNDLETTTKSIKTSVLVPILVKAIQEQQAMIEELKQEVAALKSTSSQ